MVEIIPHHDFAIRVATPSTGRTSKQVRGEATRGERIDTES
jgi:hypothetical protein